MNDLPRMSHSSLSEYSSCAQRYYLRRVKKVEETLSLPSLGGKAFHRWTEMHDLGTPVRWLDAFDEELDGVDVSALRTYGRKTLAHPDGETVDVWRHELGPSICLMYRDWRTDSPWNIYKHDTAIGVEVELNFTAGSVNIKAFVDRAMVDEHGNIGVVDLKTWSRPKATTQLPLYIEGLRQGGIPASWGAYYNARTGKVSEQKVFTGWDEGRFAAMFYPAAHMISRGYFLPSPSDDCKTFCPVSQHCDFAI